MVDSPHLVSASGRSADTVGDRGRHGIGVALDGRREYQCTAFRRGLPYGGVMATAGASALAAYCGLPELVAPLLALAVFEALWLLVRGALEHRPEFALGWRPWLEVGVTSEHSGIHTVPLGLAVITGGLAALVVHDATRGPLLPLVVASLVLTWLLAVLCVSRFLWALARYGLALVAMDGAWFLVPAALLGAAMATMASASLGVGDWTATLQVVALVAAVLGWFGYWAVAVVAAVRLRRFGLHGVPQAPWWIAMGCAGLAAAALGSVLQMSISWPAPLQALLVAAMSIAEIFAVALCVPVLVASAQFLRSRCRFRDPAVWPPTFSTAVFALGGLATGKVLQSAVFWYIGLGAAVATLVLWLATACWNAGCRLRR